MCLETLQVIVVDYAGNQKQRSHDNWALDKFLHTVVKAINAHLGALFTK